jgi:UDP-glucose 4-epimerase
LRDQLLGVIFQSERSVFSSTCATDGDPQYLPIDKANPQAPINPYGRSRQDREAEGWHHADP